VNASTRAPAFAIGLALVFTTAIVSGVSTFVNQYAVAGTSSDAFVTVRNLVVAGLLVPIAIAASLRGRARSPLTRGDWVRLLTIGLVGGAVPFLLFFHGLQLATLAGGGTTASFLYRTLFLFATVFAWFFLKERFRWEIVLGAVLLLAGSYLLLSWTSIVWTDGSLYVLAATVLWAGEYTLSKRTLRNLPSTTVALGRMGFGALFLSVYLAVISQWMTVAGFSDAQWSWVAISALLLTAFVGTWYAGLARVELGVGTAVLVLGYSVTWLLSIAVRGGALAGDSLLGTIAILAGIAAYLGRARFHGLGQGIRKRWASPLRPAS
jgi:drug/metabolite transporter (DMT)-like permease